MAGDTLVEISDKITEIDSLIFRADTGQISLKWEQYRSLHEDAETLMNMLADSLAHNNEHTPEEMYEARAKVRRANRLAATAEHHLELHPEPNPVEDEIFRAVWNDPGKTDQQIADELNAIYAYMFVNKPMPPVVEAPRERATATLGQIDARMNEIEELIWKVDIGEITMTLPEWQSLNLEAFQLDEILCVGLGKASGQAPAEIAETRRKIFALRRMSRTVERYLELHPREAEQKELSEAIQTIFDGKTPDEAVCARINSITSSIFVPRPDAKKEPEKSWLKRIFGG